MSDHAHKKPNWKPERRKHKRKHKISLTQPLFGFFSIAPSLRLLPFRNRRTSNNISSLSICSASAILALKFWRQNVCSLRLRVSPCAYACPYAYRSCKRLCAYACVVRVNQPISTSTRIKVFPFPCAY